MSILTDREFITRLSSRLEGFTQKRQGVWNCRCPICGDSQRSKRKKRFYFYMGKGKYFVRCHNCQYSNLLSSFMRDFDSELYKEYRIALFKESDKQKTHQKNKKKSIKELAEEKRKREATTGFDYTKLLKFNLLPEDHPARMEVDRRKLPYDRILYAPDFATWMLSQDLDQYYKDTFDHLNIPFMVIPFWIKKGISHVFQIRTFDPEFKPKYITFKHQEEDLKIFGMDRINPHKTVYVLEGPIDAMCVKNALAYSGMVSEMPDECDRFRLAYFLDNEPRNKDVVRQIQKLINKDCAVVLIENCPYNDVNDMHIAGIDVGKLFSANTYQGMLAQMKFNNWKKV